MPGIAGSLVVSSPSVRVVRAHRVLRQLSESTCVRACSRNEHPIIASFEPDEDWNYDYEEQAMVEGAKSLPPHAHAKNHPVPGPAGKVPANWESLLN